MGVDLSPPPTFFMAELLYVKWSLPLPFLYGNLIFSHCGPKNGSASPPILQYNDLTQSLLLPAEPVYHAKMWGMLILRQHIFHRMSCAGEEAMCRLICGERCFGVLAVHRDSLERERFCIGTDAYGYPLRMQLKPLSLVMGCRELFLDFAKTGAKHGNKAFNHNLLHQIAKKALHNSYSL